ncbi:Os02g0161701 [Oryza sativa Japonica Group]|uniref:Os02g0161701 protein n=1 Tax=Oryza sativa subsp. japonica TaxID=39947 RepID=A0A0P0VF76_ORYSJ|nr:Os02g0161701 [Oryza sativa Japonica Group]
MRGGSRQRARVVLIILAGSPEFEFLDGGEEPLLVPVPRIRVQVLDSGKEHCEMTTACLLSPSCGYHGPIGSAKPLRGCHGSTNEPLWHVILSPLSLVHLHLFPHISPPLPSLFLWALAV